RVRRRGLRRGGQLLLPLGDDLRTLGGRVANDTPQLGDRLVEVLVAEVAELPDGLGGHVGGGDPLCGDGGHECLGGRRAGGEGGGCVAFVGEGERAVSSKNDAGRLGVVERGEPAEGAAAEGGFAHERVQHRNEFGVAGIDQRRERGLPGGGVGLR